MRTPAYINLYVHTHAHLHIQKPVWVQMCTCQSACLAVGMWICTNTNIHMSLLPNQFWHAVQKYIQSPAYYVCMCVCLYVCMYVHIYIYMSIYIHIHTYMHAYIHAYMPTHAYTHTCTHPHAYADTYTYTYIHTSAGATAYITANCTSSSDPLHIRTHTHVSLYVHIHNYIPTLQLQSQKDNCKLHMWNPAGLGNACTVCRIETDSCMCVLRLKVLGSNVGVLLTAH